MKHAYLIIAHNDFYILEKLLLLIDDELNDIYIHIDKKVKNFDFDYYKKIIKKSNIYFTKRIDVRWGSFSQIECELLLLKEATKNKYSYYHLLSGVDLLLKPSKEIYDFFEKNKGSEFVALTSFNCEERIKYYYYFMKNFRNNKISRILQRCTLKIQKLLKVNRLKHIDFTLKKGANWFSITNELAQYVLSQEEFINKYFKKSRCADEMFLQTIVHNSEFKNKVYTKNNGEHQNIMRSIDWTRGEPYTYKINDFNELINSGMFFARKFSTEIDKQIIDKIYNHVRSQK